MIDEFDIRLMSRLAEQQAAMARAAANAAVAAAEPARTVAPAEGRPLAA
jgi:hypothetical protein